MKKIIFILMLTFTILLAGCKNASQAQLLYFDAVKEYKEKNFENAKILTDKAISIKPDFYQAIFLKAKILFFTKDLKNAEQIFLKLCKKAPENFDCKLWLLRCFIFEGNFEKAENFINQMIQNNTEDWRLYYYKAQIAKQQNNFEEYFSSLNYAETFLTDSAAVYLDLGLIWHEFGLSDRSSIYYTKAEILNK